MIIYYSWGSFEKYDIFLPEMTFKTKIIPTPIETWRANFLAISFFSEHEIKLENKNIFLFELI